MAMLLCCAVAAGDRDLIQSLVLEQQTDPNQMCDYHKLYSATPLLLACDNQAMDIVEFLACNTAADTNLANCNGRTPLWMCVDQRNEYMAQLLLQRALVTPDLRQDSLNHTPEHCGFVSEDDKACDPVCRAIQLGGVTMLKVLINAGADISTPCHAYSPLSLAIHQGRVDILQVLIHAGVSLKRYSNGYVPLIQAIQERNCAIVWELIQAGAEVNIEVDGYTMLMMAVEEEDMKMSSLLIQCGADVNAVSSVYQFTPLTLALINTGKNMKNNGIEDNQEIDSGIEDNFEMDYEVSSDNDINNDSNNDINKDFIHNISADLNKDYPIAHLLLKHGANPYQASPCPSTGKPVLPIQSAIEQDDASLLGLFLQNGYSLKTWYSRQDLLHTAILSGAEDCSVALIQWGFNIKQSRHLQSYLYLAAQQGLFKLMLTLFDTHPAYRRQPWVIKNKIPANISKHPFSARFFSSQRQVVNTPSSLVELSRVSVLQCVGENTQVYGQPVNVLLQRLVVEPKIKEILYLKDATGTLQEMGVMRVKIGALSRYICH